MPSSSPLLARIPLLVLGIAALVTGVWGGLLRLPLSLPLPIEHANWLTFHGPLMVCGFLGTVVGLERAIGLPDRWPYAAPLLTAAGATVLMFGFPGRLGPGLLTAGSVVLLAAAIRVAFMARAFFAVVMAIGAAAWVAGNALWFAGHDLLHVVPWWIAFLGLTIVGERLDLSRFQKPVSWARPAFIAALVVFLAGLVTATWRPPMGERLAGLGLVAMALWLVRFDLARRTISQPGLPRFMAACLLVGYGWMALSGFLWVAFAPLEAGPRYDAVLHTFFVGFVFSMIFAHAPVIFPSVLMRPVAFHPRFHAHAILLHAGLLLRIVGDLGGHATTRQWGAVLNGVAIAFFLINTVTAMRGNRRRRRSVQSS